MVKLQDDLEHPGWHLDKRVPLALIIALVIQTIGAFWWAATIQERVNNFEVFRANTFARGERVTRLEANQNNIAKTVNRIETKIDRLNERNKDRSTQ